MEPESALIVPSSWTQQIDLDACFPVRRPLAVDVGCGKGRYLVSTASRRPDMNFLGIDRLLARLRKVDRKLGRTGLDNVRLLRIEAAYAIRFLLPPASVTEFTVFFPDPWPKRRHHRRRLFGPDFLDHIDRTLLPGGRLHVASDHLDYFETIMQLLGADTRFEQTGTFVPEPDRRTDFEVLFMEQRLPIGRASFVRTG